MASFTSVLQVKGKQYTVLYSDVDIHQFTDSLGRPASPTFGGVYTLEIESPLSGDSTLFEWVVDPALFLNGQVLIKNLTGTTLKVIKFYNAYCVDLAQHFDSTGLSTDQNSLRLSLRISPQAVRVGEQFHDNDWPAPEPITDWHWADMDAQANPNRQAKQEPGLVSEVAHGVLDVLGMVPIVGEVADGANALFYLAEGNKTDAALSAAAMIPIAGNVATGAKLVRKGAKIAQKAKGLKAVKANKVSKLWKVGPYEKLKSLEAGLDAHHVGQKAIMRKFIPGYDLEKAPAILVPKVGHTIRGVNGIVSRSTKGLNNARQVVARDIRELRRVYPDVPNKALKELIELNKKMYPEEFKTIPPPKIK